MKKLLTFILVINVILNQAQEDSIQNFTNGYKYTLSTNLGFLGAAILGANGMEYTKFNAQFRRRIGKYNFRSSINRIEDYNRFYSPLFQSSDIIALNDSIITKREKYSKKNHNDIRIGFERGIKIGNNKRLYIGSDVMFGIRNSIRYYGDYQTQYYTDSNGTQHFDPVSSFSQSDYGYIHYPVNRGSLYERYIYLGIDVSIGVEMAISKRFNLTFQYIPEFTYNSLHKTSDFNNNNVFSNYSKPYLQFNLGYFDLNLSYKFSKKSKHK